MKTTSIFLLFAVAAPLSTVASPTPISSLEASSSQTTPASGPSQDALSLEATLQPFNTTHVNVFIINTYQQQMSILSWNTHFQRGEYAAHGSFDVKISNSDNEVQTMQRGPNMAQFLFDEADASHFYNLTAGATYTGLFDLTDVFSIPTAGEYTVVMDFVTRAILHTEGMDLSSKIQAAGTHVEDFPSLSIKSDPITMKLDASPPISQMQKRQITIGSCDSNVGVLPQVLAARANARDLAKRAQNSNDGGLWTEYFNDQSQTSLVSTVYGGVSNYGANGNYYGVTEYCDPDNHDAYCADHANTNAYNQLGEGTTSSITFCQRWFSKPANLTCDFPSASNTQMRDQGGLFLHELVHSPNLVGGGDRILDGNKCYDWTCVTGAAAGTNDQPKPWTIAKAFELYAYAARALGTKFCTVDVHQVDNTVLGGIAGR